MGKSYYNRELQEFDVMDSEEDLVKEAMKGSEPYYLTPCANPECGHTREDHIDYQNECCECACNYFEEE